MRLLQIRVVIDQTARDRDRPKKRDCLSCTGVGRRRSSHRILSHSAAPRPALLLIRRLSQDPRDWPVRRLREELRKRGQADAGGKLAREVREPGRSPKGRDHVPGKHVVLRDPRSILKFPFGELEGGVEGLKTVCHRAQRTWELVTFLRVEFGEDREDNRPGPKAEATHGLTRYFECVYSL